MKKSFWAFFVLACGLNSTVFTVSVVQQPLQDLIIEQLKKISQANNKRELIAEKDLNFSGLTHGLEGADLTGLNLSGVNFKKSNLSNAKLRGTQFATFQSGKTSYWSNLEEAQLTGADLSGATFNGALCQKARFDKTKTDLDKPVSFIGADLRATDFTGAQLQSAVFDRSQTIGMITKDSDMGTAFLGTLSDLFGAIAQQNKEEVIRLLTGGKKDQKINVNGTVTPSAASGAMSDDQSGPALLVCLNHWDKDIFDALVMHDADLNVLVTSSSVPLLLYALQKENADAVKSLIATKKLNQASLLSVVTAGDSSFFKQLLSGDAVSRALLGTVIDGVKVQMTKVSQDLIVHALLLTLAQQAHSGLFEDIFKTYAVEVNALILKDVAPLYAGKSLLEAVIGVSESARVKNPSEGYNQIVKFLLEKGAKISEGMISNKAVQKYIETLKTSIFALVNQCSPSTDVVAQHTTLSQLTALLTQVAGTSAQAIIVQSNQNDEYKNPLFVAVEKNSVECAQLLLTYGADATISGGADEEGEWKNVLEVAIYHNNLGMVELLTQQGGFKIDSFAAPRTRALGEEYSAIADYLEKTFETQSAVQK